MIRTLIGSAILGIGLLSLFADRADGVKKKPPLQPESPAGFSSIKLVEDVNMRRVLVVGRESIKDRDWKTAIDALQVLLNEKKDGMVIIVERDPANPQREIRRWTSAKFEANNLIGSMPAKGLKAYQDAFGAEAKTLLDAGKKKKDREVYADVAMRFRHTKAGSEANKLLGLTPPVVEPGNGRDWPSWRGNVTNTGQAVGSAPLLDKRLWSRPLFNDKLDGLNENDPDEICEKQVKAAIKQVNDLKQPVMSGFFPIASQGVMVYRTHRDVRAVALKEYKIKDEGSGEVTRIKPGQMLWKAIPHNRSLAVLLERPAQRRSWSPG